LYLLPLAVPAAVPDIAGSNFGGAVYELANNKLSGSANNSEATTRASTRSALLHLFQSASQSVFHLMPGKMARYRAGSLDNGGQKVDIARAATC
jgi:hypothetical protein